MQSDWKYAAESANGELVRGVLAASNEADALAKLRSLRLTPLTIEPSRPSLLAAFTQRADDRLSLSELAGVTRRLSDLTNAGLPLAKSLELARDQAASEKQRMLFASLAQDVRAGHALSAALSGASVKTPPFLHALAKTAESIGALPEQFTVLADHYESALKTRREITAQLIYPAALMVLIVLTMIFLSYFVLPQFETIFDNAGATAPFETRLALSAGAYIRSYLAFTPLAVLTLFVGWRIVRRRYVLQLEGAFLAAPYLGRLRRDHEIGRYCRSLAAMLKGGMPLAEAMPLAAQAVQLKAIRQELAQVETAVRTGEKLFAALAKHASPAKEVTSFLEVGEETGTLASMAEQAARFSEACVNTALKRFMALLSPLLTAIMGLVTAGVIAAVMSGVLSLNDAVY